MERFTRSIGQKIKECNCFQNRLYCLYDPNQNPSRYFGRNWQINSKNPIEIQRPRIAKIALKKNKDEILIVSDF